MKNIDTVLGLLLSVMASIPAFATSPVEERHDALVNDHKIVFFGGGQDPETDSIRNLIENFYYDQFRSFQDPEAPYFLFMSRDSQLAMGIGGLVRMRDILTGVARRALRVSRLISSLSSVTNLTDSVSGPVRPEQHCFSAS